MEKLKVGSKVRCKTGDWFKKGEIVTLTKWEEDGVHLYSNGKVDYYLADSTVERLKFQVGDKDEVTRYPELKVGQVVEVYNLVENETYLAMVTYARDCFEDGSGEPIIAITSGSVWFPVDELDDKLTYGSNKITKIYGYASVMNSNKTSTEGRKLLWERPSEVKEMTLQEVIDELGYEIKIKK